MRLRDLFKRRRTKTAYSPATPPGNPPGDFRAWQRNHAHKYSMERNDLRASMERGERYSTSRLEMLLAMCPHPDGGQWTALEMEEATSGEIHAHYFLAVKEGRTFLTRPKIQAMTHAMGIPQGLWFRPAWWWRRTYEAWARGEDVEDKLHQDYDPDMKRAGRLAVDWGYFTPPPGEYEDPIHKGHGPLYIYPTTLQQVIPEWTLCAVEEAAELLQITEAEVEEMLDSGELQGGQSDHGWDSVNLGSVLRRLD